MTADKKASSLRAVGLTAKQDRFVQEFLVDLNATQAAIRAGYSPKTARVMAAENLTKPDIARAIEAAMVARADRLRITQDRALDELSTLAFSDISHYVVDDKGVVH